MKFSIRLLLFWISVFLAFYVGVLLVIHLLWEIPISFWKLALVFIIVGVLPPTVITAFFLKRLDYMESEDINPPSFSGQKRATFKFKPRSQFPFDEVMQRVDRQWIISFSDRNNRILKFRTDTRMMSWGVCGYVKMEGENTISVVLYSMHPRSKRDEKMMNQTLRLMQAILNH